MSIERYFGNTIEEKEGIPDQEQVDVKMSPVTGEEMASELEQMKEAVKQSELEPKPETMPLEESTPTEKLGLSPEDILARQEKDKQRIETLKEELRQSSEQSKEQGDGGGNDNEQQDGDDSGDNEKRGFKMTHESHTNYKPCEACGGSGRKWLIFNCSVCHGSGMIKESEASKTQIDHTVKSQNPEAGLEGKQPN